MLYRKGSSVIIQTYTSAYFHPGRHLDEGRRGSGVQVIFVSEIARSATVLHQPLIEPDDVKWRLAGQGAATVLNCAAQADVARAAALCRVVR